MAIELEVGKRYVMRNGFLTGELREHSELFVASTYENPNNLKEATDIRSWTINGSWNLEYTIENPPPS